MRALAADHYLEEADGSRRRDERSLGQVGAERTGRALPAVAAAAHRSAQRVVPRIGRPGADYSGHQQGRQQQGHELLHGVDRRLNLSPAEQEKKKNAQPRVSNRTQRKRPQKENDNYDLCRTESVPLPVE